MYRKYLFSGLFAVGEDGGAGINFLYSNSYFLTGILSFRDKIIKRPVTGYTDIKFHVQWIREILNKHVSKYFCLLVAIN